MTYSDRPNFCKDFLEAVYAHGERATGSELAEELYGDDKIAQWQSLRSVADECKKNKLAHVSVDYMDIRLTPTGRKFIGK